MTIAKRCIQANISQLPSSHVLLLGSHVGEDKLSILQPHLLSSHVDVCLSNLNDKNVR